METNLASPDKISIKIEIERDVYATGVEMYLVIEGDSIFSGKQALKKARAVRDLVQALGNINIEEKNIQVLGVSAKVSSGNIRKTSTAVYSLLIEISDLDVLGDIIGVVMSQKEAKIRELDWQYSEADKIYDEMLKEGLKKAEERASLICKSLSHKKLGVHNLSETLSKKEKQIDRLTYNTYVAQVAFESEGHAEMTSDDLGLEINHTIKLVTELKIEYLVEPLID